MPKSAREKLSEKKEPKKVVLGGDFSGIKGGQTMFVATPQIVAEYIRKIPFGQSRTIERMRNEIARRRKCDASCPVSTAVFVRIAAEAAIEDLNEGKSPSEVIPFWRLISSKDKVAKKLAIDGAWIDEQRASEAES